MCREQGNPHQQNDKGDANDQRELHRIWDKAGETEDGVDRVIAEFNTKYLVVNENGRALIYTPAHDPILHRRYHNRMGAPDLKLLYQNRSVEVGVTEEGNAILAPVTDVWLRHDNRKQYIRGIIFDASGAPTPPDTLNLWQGFPVIPQPGSWEKLRIHVRDVICRGRWLQCVQPQPGYMAALQPCSECRTRARRAMVAREHRGIRGTSFPSAGTIARAAPVAAVFREFLVPLVSPATSTIPCSTKKASATSASRAAISSSRSDRSDASDRSQRQRAGRSGRVDDRSQRRHAVQSTPPSHARDRSE